MILLCHPRCGSEFFLRSVPDFTYTENEVLGALHGLNFDRGWMSRSSFSAKLQELRNKPADVAMKLPVLHVLQAVEGGLGGTYKREPEAAQLLELLATRSDLYVLQRRNLRAALLSFFIAKQNNLNFHGDPALLTTPFTIAFHELFYFYRVFDAVEWAARTFNVREHLVLEDLLSGAQVPSTFKFEPTRSPIKRRDSLRFKHLVQNLTEVQRWLDLLRVPGSLDADEPS